MKQSLLKFLIVNLILLISLGIYAGTVKNTSDTLKKKLNVDNKISSLKKTDLNSNSQIGLESKPEVASLLKSYDKKIYFTQNKGQWPDSILYKADLSLGQALVTKKGMIVGSFDPASIQAAKDRIERWEATIKAGQTFNEPNVKIKGHGWYMSFKNASSAMAISSDKKHQDNFNYFVGKDNAKHAKDVPNYGEITYKNVYQNIDVRYYPSAEGSLEYDIICKPGADPKKIELQLDGIDGLTVNNGRLMIKTSVGELDFPEPYSYQNINGKEVKIQTTFKATSSKSIAFDVKDYDVSKPLIIDPIALRWASWISNNASTNSHGHGIWVDPSNNAIYVTGWYQTTGLITVGAFQNTSAGGVDLFIGRYAEPTTVGGAGTRVWQTYLGGGATDNPYALEQGPDGNIYIVGYTSTNSTKYPLLGGSAFSGSSVDKRNQAGQNIFITKINQAGNSIKSAVVGGNLDENVYDLRITSTGDIIVCGSTKSTNLSTLFSGSGASNTNKGGFDVLIFKINSDLSSVLWMKNYGGSGDDQANIMLNNSINGDIYVGGATSSSNFPTVSPRQSGLTGTTNGFLQKLNSSGTVQWGSYYKGTTGITSILCMEFNTTKDKLYIGGLTDGLNAANVSSSGVFRSTLTGSTDFFIGLIGIDQTFYKGTYLGSTGDEYNMMGLNVDLNNDVYIFGYTSGTNFPVTADALQSTNLGKNDKTFTKVKSDLSTVLYGTYYGGASDDYDPVGERGIKFSNCRIYTIVTAQSNDIPLTLGAVTTTKTSNTSILEPGLVIWANPPDLDGNVVTGNQSICPGTVPSTLTGSYPFYVMPTIVRNGVSSNYPGIAVATTYQWQKSTDSSTWVDIAGGNTPNLAGTIIGALYQKTYFRRVVGGDACVLPGASGVVVKINNLTVNGNVTNVLCYGAATGAVTTSTTGGTAPYTYLWNTGTTTQNLTAKVAGSYSLTVTDATGCTGTKSFTITQPTQLQLSFTTVPVDPCGLTNGSATATVSNGTPPYTYLWNTGATGQSVSAVAAGTYTVTVTDANGCKIIGQAIVTSLNATVISGTVTNVSCSEGNNGAITTSLSGGVAPFSYLWTDGPTTANRTALIAGTYTLKVTDKNGCVASKIFTVTEPIFTVVANINNNISCYGGSNGSLTAVITGGVSPFSYLWSNGNTTATATGLSATSYSVTVTDANGCKQSASNTLNQPTQLATSCQIVDFISCYGSSDGQITVYATGGTAPYTYLWSNGGKNVNITELAQGNYSVTVTDANSCTSVCQTALTQPAIIVVSASTVPVSCNVANSGTATASVTGGTAPYRYTWNTTPQQTTATATGLNSGTYTVTVADNNGCTKTATATVGQITGLSLTISAQTNVKCYGNTTGSATVSALNGTSPYTYSWNTSPVQTTATASNLPAGVYSVTVTDKNGCSGNTTVTITQPTAALSASISNQINILCYGDATGSATVTVTGGTSPYTYAWEHAVKKIIANPGCLSTSASCNNLTAGNYIVTVTDANACITTASVTITQPASALSASITAQTNVKCYGDYTGSATVTAAGGTASYTYLWNTSPAQTTATASNLNSGTYTVTVKDANNCTTTTTVTLTQPASSLSASISTQTNILCYGNSNGSATVVAAGGTSPYTYLWSTTPAQTSATANNLAAGTYTVTITDNKGCKTTSSATITQPSGALSASITAQSNVTWFAGDNGSATVTATGGTSPYTYLWNTSPAQITASANNLTAGTYTVTITDKNACTKTASVTITQPSDPLTATIISKTNVLCYSNTTGSATVTAAGGTSPYTYKWNTTPQQTTATANNLAAGTYTVTVTDFYGNTQTTSATITQPAASLSASISSKTDAACFGTSTGSATVSTLGGTSPYTYLWNTSPAQTSATAVNLAAGSYTVTIKDDNNCTTTTNVNISQPAAALSATTSQINVLCYSDITGSATVVPTGGTSPYSYLWNTSPAQTTATASGLAAGNYTVTTTDKNGCTKTSSFTITQPASAVAANITAQTNVLCYGNSSGSATVTASGGVAPYTYLWNTAPVQTSATATGLSAGTYTVTITDNNGCKTTKSATITQPSGSLSASITAQTNVTWFGGNNGSATVTATQGTAPYTYLWNTSPAQTTANATNLTAGTYTVTVTDKNGCTTTASVTITEPSDPLTATITSKTNILCYGNNTGSATVTAAGGTSPYTYKWNTTPNQTNATATGLTAGTYIVTVTDFYGNNQTTTATLTQPAAVLSASINSKTNVLCFGDNSGSATVLASGGTAPYTYLWNTSPAQTTATANNLAAGTYTVTVKDDNNCSSTTNVTINQPTAALSASTSQTNVLCYSELTGYATVTPAGGTSPYTYKWNTTPVQTNATASALSAGNYIVTVTDKNGCEKTASVTISQPASEIAANITAQTNVLCYGNSTGTATVTASGGVGPYTYLWNTTPAQTSATASGLAAGTYNVTVTDKNACSKTTTATILEPSGALSASITAQSNVTSFGGSNGSATVTATEGTAPYTYLWNTTPAQTTAKAINLSAGIYTVTVTDKNGCTTTVSTTITQPSSALSATITSQTNILCYGNNTGSATVTASGGTTPYTYSWSTVPVQTGVTASNLTAGTYTVTVTDKFNNTVTVNATITQPSEALSANVTSQTNVLCYGNNTGSATVTATGGSGPYTYLWNTTPAQSTATANNLTSGNYKVTITDNNNCSTTANTTITQPAAALASSITSKTNVLCYSENTGSATVTTNGGTAPYTYSWNTSPVQTNATAYNLPAGSYTVTVKDNNNCSTTANLTITQPDAVLTASISSHLNVLCRGDITGSATVTANGGTAPYTYLWNTSPAQTTATASNLAAGTYSVTVTDKNLCDKTVSVSILQPALDLTASITAQSNVTWFGGNNGSATVTANGGTAPYTYLWNTTPAQTNANAVMLAAGTYTVTVTDKNGCNTTTSVTITQPSDPLTATITSQTNILCFGNSTGSATVTANGGTAPYTYLWNTTPAQTTATANNLSAGTYTVTVTDKYSNQITVDATITEPSEALDATVTAQTNVLCYGNITGSVTVTATGGTAPYTYLWNTTPVQNTATASNLTAGNYKVTITDKNGCSTTTNATITQPAAALSATVNSHINVLCYGDNSGSATVATNGGTAPYTYLWNTTPAQTNATANNLAAGNYTVTVKDDNNCSTTANISITQPAAALSASVNSQVNVLCHGDLTGSATVTANGGTTPYTYLWNTSPAQTTATASGLAAGNYSVTVTDKNECTKTANITITEPAFDLTASITSQTNVTYFGGNNGSATVLANYGTAPYTYLWNTTPAQTAATANNLIAGTYTVTVTDKNGCKSTASVTITQPSDPLTATITSQTNILCYGNNTGSATVTANGGTTPYTYLWNTIPAQTSATANNLTAGTYTVTVTDKYNNTITTNAIITQPTAALSALVTSQTNVLCYGNTTGMLTVTTTGGSGPYTYMWNTTPAQTTATASDLAAGIYKVTITDDNGCSTTTNATVTQPAAPLSAAVNSHTNVLCNGDNTGSATVTATGGTAPYTYIWNTSPEQHSATSINLNSNIYTVTVTDKNGCDKTTSITITQPTEALNASITAQQDVLCYGDNTASATVTATGGTAPYTYFWSNAMLDAQNTNLSAGTYTVTVTDKNACTTTVNTTILQPSGELSASITSQSNVTFFGGNNGSATVTATAGTAPYTYLWNTIPAQTNTTAGNLSAGTYTVIVTDKNGCNSTAHVIITQPESALSASITSLTNVKCYGDFTGSATVTAAGGTAPYTYLWNTSPAQTTTTIINLNAGTYKVTVTDFFNNTVTTSATITQPSAQLASSITSQSDVLCYGDNTGLAAVTTTGGTSPYTYLWSNSMHDAQSTNLSAGSYNVTITDNNGCNTTNSVYINQPASALSASITAQSNVTWFGGNNGSATVTPAGGTSPYTYLWNTVPPQTSAKAYNLTAGTYTVTVTDNNTCTTTVSVTITQPSKPLTATITSKTNIICFGDNTGSATVTAAGGTAPYSYLWSNSMHDAQSTNLSAGSYTVTVTDYYDNIETATVIITEPSAALSASVNSKTNVSCFGNSTGSATVSVTGGTAPYFYLWSTSPAQANATANNLAAGTYTVTITDYNNCSTTAAINITQPAAALSATTSQANILCYGDASGSATINPTGGTSPYTYLWNTTPAQTNLTASGLSAGSYTVTITDNNGCEKTANITVNQPASEVAVNITAQTNVLCYGNSTGTATVTASGGVGPYTHFWNSSPPQTTATASGLVAGTYNVIVTDKNSCSKSTTATILEPSGELSASITAQSNVTTFGGSNGSATVTATAGTAPYSYLWSTTPAQTTATTINLSAGTYTVTVTDKNGCTTTVTTTITQPTSALSASITSLTNVLCFGNNTGSATVTASGGTTPYTYLWSTVPAQTDITAINLSAGTYTVTVTDKFSNTVTAIATITEPSEALNATITSHIDVMCYGNATAMLTVTTTGGSSPYTYSWNTTPAQSSATATDLTVGSYQVNITDKNGCTTTANANITQPVADLSASITAKTNVLCFGNNTGSATVSANYGTAPYTYLWSTTPAQTTATAINLSAGTYTVTVTDKNGCSTSVTTTITQPTSALSAYITAHINILCFGDMTGSATVSANYGTAPYSYEWNTTPAQTTANAANLAAGSYTVTVTDKNGCSETATIAITQPAAELTASITSQTDVLCYGNKTGSVTVAANGGTTPYAYLWNTTPAQTNATAVNLVAGNYRLTVTDKNGCSNTINANISEPSGELSASITAQTNVTKFGGNNGSATVTATGGTSPYTYLWNTTPAQTNATANNLTAGTYTVTVTDKNGCSTTAEVTISQPSEPLAAIITSQTNILCSGNNTGSATVTATGGTSPYTYLWSTIPAQTNATANNLTAGTYTVTVTDFYGNAETANVNITQPDALSAAVNTQNNVLCYGDNSASATVTVTGGTAPFSYVWNTTPAQTSATAHELTAGTYTVTVKDINNCSTTADVTITQPASELSASIVSQTNVVCNETNGTATVNATGGTAPYSYLWSNAMHDAQSTNLAAGSYTVTITDANNCTTTVNVTIQTLNTPPAITQQPLPQTICSGASTTFETTASGSGLTYKWFSNGIEVIDGTHYLGSNSSTLSISNTNMGFDGNQYTCVVTNACAYSITTDAAALTIKETPVITSTTDASRDGSGSVTLGSTASFGTINWYAAPVGGSSLGSGNSFTTPSLTTSTTYYVEATSYNCTSPRVPVNAIIHKFDCADNLIVTNTNDSGFGTLRRALLEANSCANIDTIIFNIPTSDPGYNPETGKFTICVTSGDLPAITKASLVIDGTSENKFLGNINNEYLGTGGKVGTDGLTLSKVLAPMVQVVNSADAVTGLEINAKNVSILNLSISGFGTRTDELNLHGNIVIDENAAHATITQSVFGLPYQNDCSMRSGSHHIIAQAADSVNINNNLFYNSERAAVVEKVSKGWSVVNNEFVNSSTESKLWGALLLNNSDNNTVEANLIYGSAGIGVDMFTGSSYNMISDNTIHNNGLQMEYTAGIRVFGDPNNIWNNIIYDNYGAGIAVTSNAYEVYIKQNSIYGNGSIGSTDLSKPSNQVGIDLLTPSDNMKTGTAPYYSLNHQTPINGGNDMLNFPVLDSAIVDGGNLIITGWVQPGAKVELFIADLFSGAVFPQGKTYLTSFVEGSVEDLDNTVSKYGPGLLNGVYQGSDSTNRFRIIIPIPAGVSVGTLLTSTAYLNYGTSEFSGALTVMNKTLLVSPVLECLFNNNDGTYTAVLGYNNPNGFAVSLPVGNDNKFSPAPEDRGQPASFSAGRQENVFRVTFNGGFIWTLNGHNLAVTNSSPLCPADLSVNKYVNDTVPKKNDTITFSIKVKNNSNWVPNTGMQIKDTLSSLLIYVSHTADLGTYNPSTGIWSIDRLEPMQQTVLTIKAVIIGSTENKAVIIAQNQYDSNPDNNSSNVSVTCDTTSGGHDGGIESHGNLASKIALRGLKRMQTNENAIYSHPELLQNFNLKDVNSGRIQTAKLAKSKGSEVARFIPENGPFSTKSFVTTPGDLIGMTNAVEILAVDYFDTPGKRLAAIYSVVTNPKTVYDHTKVICDRLSGATLDDIRYTNINGKSFILAKLLREEGYVDYSISFIAYKNGNNYYIDNQWNQSERHITGDNVVLNFQVWSVSEQSTVQLVQDIISKLALEGAIIYYDNKPAYPSVYVRNGFYQNGKLYLNLHNVDNAKSFYVRGSTAKIEDGSRNTYKQDITVNTSKNSQIIIPSNHIYDFGFTLENDVVGGIDVLYYADGPWAVDKSTVGTDISQFDIYPYSDTTNATGKYLLERDIMVKGTVQTTATVFRNIKSSSRTSDMTNYDQIEFYASSNLPVEVIVTKKGITDWSKQYRKVMNFSNTLTKYSISYTELANTKGENTFTANDVVSVVFNVMGNGTSKAFNINVSNLAFSNAVVTDVKSANISSALLFENYPNPFNNYTKLSFELKNPSDVKLEVFDMLSNRVATIIDGYYPTGKTNITYLTTALNDGIYFYKLTVNGETITRKMVKVK